jgi:hypothetical protein
MLAYRQRLFRLLLTAGLVVSSLGAQETRLVSQMLDRVVDQEHAFMARIRSWSPVVETYIQEMPDGDENQTRPIEDHYYLGRLTDGTEYTSLLTRTDPPKGSRVSQSPRSKSMTFFPNGFAQMAYIDTVAFDRKTYSFEYVRREFLGEVRCLVFDVSPLDKEQQGRFVGRIWVEDRDYNVVRSNGTYANSAANRFFFHFDSWRVNVLPGVWIPACIYVEESAPAGRRSRIPRFKGQTRFWAYNTAKDQRLEELTSILVESQNAVKDQSEAKDASPLESQRAWERQAEENIIQRLEKSGLLARTGEVDAVLNTVVNNLIVSNGLAVEAQCRILLTTPLESFAVGHTIVLSRGLVDVLSDEASLALVLADELAHIALGYRTNTQFAFTDQTMMSDEEMLQRFRFQRKDDEIAAASRKAIEILGKSPYRQKLGNAGLFLRALGDNAKRLPNLIRANLGNQLGSMGTVERFSELVQQAPPLEQDKLDQIAALPIGSRIKLDPWTNQITMMKNQSLSLLSSREKMPFELSPSILNLTRVEMPAAPQAP